MMLDHVSPALGGAARGCGEGLVGSEWLAGAVGAPKLTRSEGPLSRLSRLRSNLDMIMANSMACSTAGCVSFLPLVAELGTLSP